MVRDGDDGSYYERVKVEVARRNGGAITVVAGRTRRSQL